MLEDEGAEVVFLPLLEFLPPTDQRPLYAAAERISRYDWIVFASPSGVAAFAEATRSAGTDDQLRRARCAVIGPSTGRAAREINLNVVVEATSSTSSGMFKTLRSHLQAGEEILLPAAEEGRTELEQYLREDGFSVTRVAAYQTAKRMPHEDDWHKVIEAAPNAVIFASPRTAEAFVDLPGARNVLERAAVVAIGPTTSEALRTLSIPAAATAERPTAEALVEAVVLAMAGKNH
jgi:uroporphyrinogen-III synthase